MAKAEKSANLNRYFPFFTFKMTFFPSALSEVLKKNNRQRPYFHIHRGENRQQIGNRCMSGRLPAELPACMKHIKPRPSPVLHNPPLGKLHSHPCVAVRSKRFCWKAGEFMKSSSCFGKEQLRFLGGINIRCNSLDELQNRSYRLLEIWKKRSEFESGYVLVIIGIIVPPPVPVNTAQNVHDDHSY